MNPTDSNQDLRSLLKEFVVGDRSEEAFAVLVDRLSGLVYASALRRTSDEQIAEEVTQNVFSTIARKADSLRGHPAVMAWVFNTTRYEASNVMRAEKRRKKRQEIFASQHLEDGSPEGAAAWRDAIPFLDASIDQLPEKDREIVLLRFFDEQKFSEIARLSGRSEAACKMQLKRALEKLSGLFHAKGVTLSAAAISSGLVAEFSQAAPAKVVTAVLSNSLTGSVITNTIIAMGTIKTASLTSAAILAMASVPLLWQASEAAGVREEIASVDAERLELLQRSKVRVAGVSSGVADRARSQSIAAKWLEEAERPIDAETLIESLREFLWDEESVGLLRALLPVVRLEPEAFDQVLVEVGKRDLTPEMRDSIMYLLVDLAPAESSQTTIELLIGLGVDHYVYSVALNRWAEHDPRAAYAWFERKQASGELESKGIGEYTRPSQMLMVEMVTGMALKDPERALQLYRENAVDFSKDTLDLEPLAENLGLLMKESGDASYLRHLIGLQKDAKAKASIANSAMYGAVEYGDFDNGFAFIRGLFDDPAERVRPAVDMLLDFGQADGGARIDWYLQNIDSTEGLQKLAKGLARNRSEGVAERITAMPLGAERDQALAGFATGLRRSEKEKAVGLLEKIGDTQLRERVREVIENLPASRF